MIVDDRDESALGEFEPVLIAVPRHAGNGASLLPLDVGGMRTQDARDTPLAVLGNEHARRDALARFAGETYLTPRVEWHLHRFAPLHIQRMSVRWKLSDHVNKAALDPLSLPLPITAIADRAPVVCATQIAQQLPRQTHVMLEIVRDG